MKNYLLSLLFCCLLCGGCASVPKDPDARAKYLQELALDVKDVAEMTTIAVVLDKADLKDEFEAAVVALKQVESSDSVDIQMVINILLSLNLEELKSQEVQLYVKGGKVVIRRLTRELNVKNSDEVKLFAKALREGIESAIYGEVRLVD